MTEDINSDNNSAFILSILHPLNIVDLAQATVTYNILRYLPVCKPCLCDVNLIEFRRIFQSSYKVYCYEI
jgi:hypothetical protein